MPNNTPTPREEREHAYATNEARIALSKLTSNQLDYDTITTSTHGSFPAFEVTVSVDSPLEIRFVTDSELPIQTTTRHGTVKLDTLTIGEDTRFEFTIRLNEELAQKLDKVFDSTVPRAIS